MFFSSSLLSVAVGEVRGGADRRYAFGSGRLSTAGPCPIASAELRIETVASSWRELDGEIQSRAVVRRWAGAQDGGRSLVGER
jgi:hypothetical protein